MQIYQVPGSGYFEDIIRTFKHRTLTRQAKPGCVPPEWCEPLPIAQYLLARTDDGTKAIGVAEGYFLDQMYHGYESFTSEVSLAVALLCPIDKLAFFQTIYVEPEFRTQTPYSYLCLAMIYLGVKLGAQGGICLTHADSEFHCRLYAKTGGRLLTHVDVAYPSGMQMRDAVYYFDLPALCTHLRLKRVLELLHLDMELAYDTYNWRYNHSSETQGEAMPGYTP